MLPKPKRIEDKEYREFIRQKKCIFCGHEPPNFCCHAHTGGKGIKCGDDRTFPACFQHHTAYDSGRQRFLRRYGSFDLEKYMDELRGRYNIR